MPKATDFLAGTASVHDQPAESGRTVSASSIKNFLRDTESPLEVKQQEVRSASSFDGPLRYPAMVGSEALRAGLTVLGTPGNIEKGLFPSEPNIFPTGQDLLTDTGRLGLTQRADLLPDGSGEKAIAATAGGAGAAIPFALMGAPGATLTSGAAGGLITEVSKQAGAPESVAEGLGTLAGVGTNLAMTLPRSARTAAAQEFIDAGMPLRSAALTTDKESTRKLLGAGAPLDQTEQDLGDSIERIASRLGPSRNWQDAGLKVQELARNWINPVRDASGALPANSLPALEHAAWEPVDLAIPPTALTPQTNFEGLVQDLASKGGVNRELVQKTMPGLVDAFDSALRRRGRTGMAPLGTPGAVDVAATPTWADARTLRSAIGDMMRRPSVANAIGPDTLDSMYAALTKDLQATAQRAGALPEFNEALQTSNELRNFKDQILGKITSSDTGNRETIMPGQAAQNIISTLRKGDLSLHLLRHYLPEAADEIGGLQLRQIGLAKPQEPGSAIASGFSRQMQNLENAGSLEALVPNPRDLQAVRAAASISEKVKTLREMPDNVARAGLLFSRGGSYMGEMLTGALLAHHYDVTGSGDPIYNLLLGGAVGGSAGAYAPLVYSMGRNALSNNKNAAAYAGLEKAGILSRVLPAGAGATVGPDDRTAGVQP